MKKMLIAALAAAALLTGCTSIESTQRFNGVAVGNTKEKVRCVVHVQIPGIYFLGLPIFVGGLGDGKMSMFTYNQDCDNLIFLLTKQAKQHGANRIIDLHVVKTESFVPFPFFSKTTIQASATGVTSRQAAIKRTNEAFDLQP